MNWIVDQGVAIGYHGRSIATVIEKVVFEPGQSTLLLGLNGQGKTTSMKTMAGLLPPVAGSLGNRLFYLSDDVDFPPSLTPREILKCLNPEGKQRALGTNCWPGSR